MHPSLVVNGSFEVRSYAVALGLAAFVGAALVIREGRRAGLPAVPLLVACLGAVACGLLGARLNSWLSGADPSAGWPNLNLGSLRGGLVSFGGIAGAMAFTAACARVFRWNAVAFLDLIAPVIPLAESIHRWGCFFNGCCFGRRTDGLLGFYLPDSSGLWAHRYPTQLMISLYCLLLFAWLWRRRGRASRGDLILSYSILYSVGRLAIGALRADEPAFVGFLSVSQLTALSIAGIAAALLMHVSSRPREAQRSVNPPKPR
jgi:phosphatidylglycerol:prolipoprotein diacylglycerol transferase